MTTTRPVTTSQPAAAAARSKDTPTHTLDVGGTSFAHRQLGPRGGTPLVFLHQFTAVLDDWDPRVIYPIAAQRHVITFDNRGIGASGGKVPRTIAAMAADAAAFIRALGHEQVDLLGFSLGGGVAQDVALQNPELVRRLILTGTGHRGGGGLTRMPLIVGGAYAKAALTCEDPRQFLFFKRDAVAKRAGTEYIARLRERTADRDKPISHQARIVLTHKQPLELTHLPEPAQREHDSSRSTRPQSTCSTPRPTPGRRAAGAPGFAPKEDPLPARSQQAPTDAVDQRDRAAPPRTPLHLLWSSHVRRSPDAAPMGQ